MYGDLTCTKTRDTSRYGYHYLSGLLRMETERTIANISRQAGVSEQNMHHYISESPWSGHKVIEKVAGDIGAIHTLRLIPSCCWMRAPTIRRV